MNNFVMKVTKLEEAGFKSAMIGLAKSYKINTDRAIEVSKNLYNKGHGHNKFLEHMVVWFDVTAPRYWWQEADTYRVGTSKQSDSTMHTLKKELKNSTYEKFCEYCEDESCSITQYSYLMEALGTDDIVLIKKRIPEGFLQSREWMLSYKTIREIIVQRENHRLPHWKSFINQIKDQVEHIEYLI